ncbi:hypothetical protein FI667_g13426, partial [Globisporangium splendens]
MWISPSPENYQVNDDAIDEGTEGVRTFKLDRSMQFTHRDGDTSSGDESDEGGSRQKRSIASNVLWPPGMDKSPAETRIPRFGSIRSVDLEHHESEEEWRDYWVWLHWYSSWQVWYLKNDISRSKSRRKQRRGDRRESTEGTEKRSSYRKPAEVR